jgi:subtilisin family serine protease
MENNFSTQFGRIPDKVETTGRFLVSFINGDSEKKAMNVLKKASPDVASTSDFSDAPFTAQSRLTEAGSGIYYKELGIAIVNYALGSDQMAALLDNREAFHNIIVEPERVVYAINTLDQRYLQGYYDAVKHLYEKAQEGKDLQKQLEALADQEATWGLVATNVPASRYTGKGVNMAILDTGFYSGHPDFIGRVVAAKSFIEGEDAEDLNGHGTHCIGTAVGSQRSTLGPRYGIAHEANVFAGKVLSNTGRGTDGSIFDGMEWALQNNCKIVSMSLGAPAAGQPYSQTYETLGKRAISKGTLIVAAAGNDSARAKGIVMPVSHPANCPSILSVAAIDSRFKVADFSNSGQVDLAAPGVDILSCWKSPENAISISGTSMATPYVAGIAALYAEANPQASPYEIWHALIANARRLDLPSNDVGAGLVQAK